MLSDISPERRSASSGIRSRDDQDRFFVGFVLVPTFTLVLIGCAPRPKIDLNAEANAVRQRYADCVAAEKRRDLAATMEFLAPDVIIQTEASPAIKGIEAARGLWKQVFEMSYTDIVDVEPRTVVVAQSGDLAYDVGSWILKGKAGSSDERGKSMIVWQKRGGQWKVAAISFSMDNPPFSPGPATSSK